jgi:DNA polymerase-3 subunit delta'
MLLNNIPGQISVRKALLGSINKDRLASTYLFYGLDGVGKWTMALALAALSNCETPVKDNDSNIIDACGICRNCRQIENCSFAEILFALPLPPHKNDAEAAELTVQFLDQKREEPYKIISSKRQMSIPIKSAREIKRKTGLKPPAGIKRIILFYQMDKMLPSSADSLLKLIEEPPPDTIIILTAQDYRHLQPTIQSRAQKIIFKPIGQEDIRRYLEEKYDIPSDRARLYACLAEGSIGRAIDLIDNEDESSLRQVSFLAFKSLFSKDTPSVVSTVNDLVNFRDRSATESILSRWQSFLSDILILKYGKAGSEIVNSDLKKELDGLAASLADGKNLSNIKAAIREISQSLRRNVHLRPAMISLVIKLKQYIAQSP